MCGKKCFDKIGAEFALAKNACRVHAGNRMECRIYFCKECNSWHLTSQPRGEYGYASQMQSRSRTVDRNRRR